jgi:outer membrane protein assembly factor BamB
MRRGAVLLGCLAALLTACSSSDEPADPVVAPDPIGPFGEPRFVAGNVVVPQEDAFVAFDPLTRQQVWRSEECAFAEWASPIEGSDTKVAAVACLDGHHGLDGATGELLWDTVSSSEVVDRIRTGPDVVMYASTDGGRAWVVDKQTGDERWGVGVGSASLAANTTHVFVATDFLLTAHDAHTGEETWVAGYPSSGLLADDRGVYARGNDHRMRRLDPATGDLVWEAERIEEDLDWSEVAVITDETIVVQRTRGAHEITVFDIETGDVLWGLEGGFGDGAEARVWVSGDDEWIVIADMDREVMRVHDDRTGEVVADLGRPGTSRASVHEDHVAYVYLDPSGRQRLAIEPIG